MSKEDIKLYQLIQKENINLFDPRIKDFVQGGFAVSEQMDELKTLETTYWHSRTKANGVPLTIAPTLGCNFACDYCFQGQNKAFNVMPDTVQNAIVDRVEKMYEKFNLINLSWYGGEPLIERDIVFKLGDRLVNKAEKAKKVLTAMVVTNGWFLDKDTAKKLENIKVRLAQITLDGPAIFHDAQRYLLSRKPTYHRIIENICSAIDEVKMMFSIRVNIDDRNQDHIMAMIDEFANYGLCNKQNLQMYFAPVEGITKGCQDASEYSMSKKKYGQLEASLIRYSFNKRVNLGIPFPPKFFGLCTATHPHSVVITPNGDMHKCWDTVSWPEFKVGTIFDYDDMYDGDEYKKWADWSPFEDPICRNCKILPTCAGSCSYKYIHTEDLKGEAAALPCPSWKYNINEKLFLRAVTQGLVKPEEWDPKTSMTNLATREHQYDESTMRSLINDSLTISNPEIV